MFAALGEPSSHAKREHTWKKDCINPFLITCFHMTARLTRRTSYVLRIHIIDIVGKSKQVILYHTHHTGGVTDIVGYQNMLL